MLGQLFKKDYWLFLALILTAAIPAASIAANKEKIMPPPVVETVIAKATTWRPKIQAIGSLEANQGIIVRSEINGRVTKIFFKSGQFVKAGEPLVQFNPDILKAQLQQSRANLSLSKLQLDRAKDLYKRKVMSVADYDKAVAAYTTDKALVNKAKAQLDQTLIEAPFNGYLGIRRISLGDFVSAGQDLVNLQQTTPLLINFHVPENAINQVRKGQTIYFTTDAFPRKRFKGTVTALESLLDSKTRTLSVQATAENSDNQLKPGMFVNVELLVGKPLPVVSIPLTALTYSAEGDFVFKVVKGRAKRTAIDIAERTNTLLYVKSGLKPGDIVISAGQLKVKDDEIVMTPKQMAEAASKKQANKTERK